MDIVEIIKKQVWILESVDDLRGQLTKSLKPFLEDTVVSNSHLSDIEESCLITIESVTDENFRDWIEWYVYETEFGSKDLLFSVGDDKDIKPTLENILKYYLVF